MTLLDHPSWPVLLPLLRVQRYDRDGGHVHPRFRIEVAEPSTRALRAELLGLEVECIARCGRMIHPVRERHTRRPAPSSMYLAVACELGRRYDCCRGRSAADEYARIVDLVRGYRDPRQPSFLEAPR